MPDKQQLDVIQWKGGPALVPAGPGSGKTTSATYRVAKRVIEDKLDAKRILMLTFTNKAAAEMRTRLRALLQDAIENYTEHFMPRVMTFHSFGYHFITKNKAACELDPNGGVSIMDEREAKEALKASMASYELSAPLAKQAKALLESAGNAGIALSAEPAKLAERQAMMRTFLRGRGLDDDAIEDLIAVYTDYTGYKSQHGMMDFSDLILRPYYALRDNPELAERMQKFLLDISVDEAQDTNDAQFSLIRMLAPPEHKPNLVLIGDIDQSIYRFRDAEPENLARFVETYNAEVLMLENNYRSRPTIVGLAQSLIEHNASRFDKTMAPVKDAHGQAPVSLECFERGDEMAEFVARGIRNSLDAGTSADEIAVLYRQHALTTELELKLVEAGIPYRLRGRNKLTESREARLLFAAVRYAANPGDDKSVKRLAEMFPGVGAKVVDVVTGNAKAKSTAQSAKAHAFISALDELRSLEPEHLPEWFKAQPGFTKFLDKLTQERNKRDRSRDNVQNQNEMDANRQVRQRLSLIFGTLKRGLENTKPAGEETVEDKWARAMEQVLQVTSEGVSAPQEAVTLSTLHGAKGLEWDNVYLFGFSEGLTPSDYRMGPVQNNDDESAMETYTRAIRRHQEEERCLAYVGATRARERLHLCHADEMVLFDRNRGRMGKKDFTVSSYALEMTAGGESLRRKRHKANTRVRKNSNSDWARGAFAAQLTRARNLPRTSGSTPTPDSPGN